MKVWVIVGLLILAIVLLSIREGFDATDKIKNPSTWNDVELTRIRKLVTPESTLTDSEIRTVIGGFWSYELPSRLPNEPGEKKGWSVETNMITMSDISKYLDGVVALNPSTYLPKRSEFEQLLKAYYIDQGQSVFQQARNYVADYTRPTVPTQTPTTPEPTPTGAESEPDFTTRSCPTGYTWDMISRKCKKQVGATCPSGFELSRVGCKNVNGENIVPPTCAENGVFDPDSLKCVVYTAGTTTTTSGTTSGTTPSPSTTTGGSSGNLITPTSGGGGALSGKNVWGPIFVGLGDSASGSAVDSTKTREYPELLGGNSGKSSARIDGVGIVSPSQPGFGLDLGVLPSTGSLGTDPLSRFLPFSRQPGDMDVVADPYRLANSYSTKNFSSQRDPVPFLTDFSAFYR